MKQYWQFRSMMRPALLAVREEHHTVINHALLVSLGMTPDEAHRWSAKTLELQQSCGCKTGAMFMMATLLLYPLVWHWTLTERLHTPWLHILIWLSAAFVAGGIGKLTGLLGAQIRIRIRLRDIRSRVKESSRHG